MHTPHRVDQPFRFVKAVARANLGPRAAPLKALMFVLASMADESLGTHGASIPELSRLSGCSESTTRDVVHKALASGYISLIREGKGRTTSVYQLNINRLESLGEREDGHESELGDSDAPFISPTLVAQAPAIQAPAIQTSAVQTSGVRGSGVQTPEVRLPALGSQRSPGSEALPLQRSTQTNSNSSAPERDVFDEVSAGAGALVESKCNAWRRQKMLEMLQPAFIRWNATGITTCPVEKALEIADLPGATPARVQFLLDDIESKIASPRPGGGKSNPIALLIWGLGDSQSAMGRPRDVPRSYTDRWAQEESQALGLRRAQDRLKSTFNSVRSQVEQLRAQAVERTVAMGSAARPAMDMSRLGNQAFGIPHHMGTATGG